MNVAFQAVNLRLVHDFITRPLVPAQQQTYFEITQRVRKQKLQFSFLSLFTMEYDIGRRQEMEYLNFKRFANEPMQRFSHYFSSNINTHIFLFSIVASIDSPHHKLI